MIRTHGDRVVIGAGSAMHVFQASSSDGNQMKFLRRLEVATTSISSASQNGASREAPHVVDGCFSASGEHFAVITSSKTLAVFSTGDWMEAVVSLPKTPTRVLFDQRGDLVVSDKAGSVRVYRQPMTHDQGPAPQSTELLGHISMLLDFCFSNDGKLIFTVDRDEKLRISRYPQAFVIEAFCLGHSSFINTVVCLPDGKSVVTAGGDSSVRVWSVADGRLLAVAENVCDGPIRKLVALPSRLTSNGNCLIIVLPDRNEGRLPRLTWNYANYASLSIETPMHYRDSIFDVTITPSGLAVSLGQKGIWVGYPWTNEVAKTVTHEGMSTELLGAFKEALETDMKSRPRLTELSKTGGFDNLKAYHELKNERLQQKKKKKKAADS